MNWFLLRDSKKALSNIKEKAAPAKPDEQKNGQAERALNQQKHCLRGASEWAGDSGGGFASSLASG